jgi:3-oxoacyl-[acyl-carrier-protein] synthase III
LWLEDIDAFCIHQGSAAIVDAVARRFEDAPVEKFIKDMVETGNTVSSSIPLLLEKHVMDADLEARRAERVWRGPVVGLGDYLSAVMLS